MRSNDLNQSNRERVRIAMQSAIKAGDTEEFYRQFDNMIDVVAQEVQQQYEQRLSQMEESMDARILTARGVHQLTSAERNYYDKVIGAMKSNDPRQALKNIDVVMPETVIDSVFEDLRENHPLLSKIEFTYTGAAIKVLMNTNGQEIAVWGKLTDEIVKELTGGFKEVDATLCKLSAFLPVSKAMLDLGPQWLDKFVREILYEAIANGMEVGIVAGTGKDMPIGMIREVGDNVTVTGGEYPEKTAMQLDEINPDTIGNLLGLLSMDENGKTRAVRDVLLIVNHQDYYTRVMPATTLLASDGSYRNDVMPYPMTIVQSGAVEPGKAVIGLGKRYFAAVGTDKGGKIEYSDQYHFLEDERVYLIKVYGNGMPKDNNAFIVLDVSNLQPASLKVVSVDEAAKATVATLSSLQIGAGALTPAFAAGTVSYTAATENASNVIRAQATDAAAEVEITVNGKAVENGRKAEWQSGANTVKVKVTAADETTVKEYTVTVTKS